MQGVSTPIFDDKPALSLKDALTKAMNEHKEESSRLHERNISEDYSLNIEPQGQEKPTRKTDEEDEYNKKIELKIRKEIDEEVLRKLLDE